MAAIASALGEIPDRPFQAPTKIIALLFASRAGSSYAGRLLANTPYFKEVGENFAPDQLAAIADRRALPDLHSAAQWMIGHRGSPQAFGYKAGFTVLTSAAFLGFLDQTLARTQLLLLRRRDRIAQAVSLTKAELSGRFHSIQKGGRAVTFDDFDADLVAKNLSRIKRTEGDLADFIASIGREATLFYYEDLCADPAGFVETICTLLDLPVPESIDTDVDLEILSDAISEDWIMRFREAHPDA